MYGLTNTVSKQMWDENKDVVEMMFQNEADKYGLKLADAQCKTIFQCWIPGDPNDDEDYGITIPSDEANANSVVIMYKWDD